MGIGNWQCWCGQLSVGSCQWLWVRDAKSELAIIQKLFLGQRSVLKKRIKLKPKTKCVIHRDRQDKQDEGNERA